MRDIPIQTYDRWFEDEKNPRAPTVLKKVVLKEDFDILGQAYRELEEKYHERGHSMRESGNMVRSLFVPYLFRIKKIIAKPIHEYDMIIEIAGIIKELEKHTHIGDL